MISLNKFGHIYPEKLLDWRYRKHVEKIDIRKNTINRFQDIDRMTQIVLQRTGKEKVPTGG